MRYGWFTFDPKIWYKGRMNTRLGPISDREIVYVKQNEEMPVKGKTFWILASKSRAMHVSDELLGDYVTLQLENGKPVTASIEEIKKLNILFAPVVRNLIQDLERQKRIAQRLKKSSHHIPKLKAPKPQGC